MESGNRSSTSGPEEINRKIVDHISDINLPYMTYPANIFCVRACRRIESSRLVVPMYEVLTHYRPKIDRSDALDRLGLTEDGYSW